jgi:hypothetical protein
MEVFMLGTFKVFSVGVQHFPAGNKDGKATSEKYRYTFLNGLAPKSLDMGGELFGKCETLAYWSDCKRSFTFMEPCTALVDIDGTFTKILEVQQG